ncbi:hypothetical protein [Nocardia sp. NPDC004604]|uniref:hypothetical protein n=1 Tax=Nocardia sp. NPDC004604 TaxID=3157013 RepID=UPI0033A26B55
MPPEQIPPDGAGDGTPTLYFDPDTFPNTVSGVASACDHMSTVVATNPKTPGHSQGDFGTVGQAWLEFHQAWADEAVYAMRALGVLVGLLPAASTDYQHTDHGGGAAITRDASGFGHGSNTNGGSGHGDGNSGNSATPPGPRRLGHRPDL